MNEQELNVYYGSKLRALRKKRKISMDSIAKRAGVTFQQLQKYETGKNRISLSKLHLICDALEVDVRDFMGLEIKEVNLLADFNKLSDKEQEAISKLVYQMGVL